MLLPEVERLLLEISLGRVSTDRKLQEGSISARRLLYKNSSLEITQELLSYVDDLTTRLLMTLLDIPNSRHLIA
jgi:hypothetical protein